MNRVFMACLAIWVCFLMIASKAAWAEGGHGSGETFQKTVWSEKSELFMEYDPPVSGKLGGFLLHLTDLKTFKPVSDAKVTLVLTAEDGKPVSANMPFTGRPGIYQGTVVPAHPGLHTFSLQVKTGTGEDEIKFSGLSVGKKGEPFVEPAGHTPDAGNGKISFLKEQQWSVDFAVQRVEKRTMSPVVTVTGELAANPVTEGIISAPLAGMVSFDKPISHIGQRLVKGEELCHIEPPIFQDGGADQLAAQVAEAKNRVALAQKELDRAKRLVEGKAAPQKRLEEAEIMLRIAQANLAPLNKSFQRIQSGSSCRHVVLKAPLTGSVVEVNAVNGAHVQAGQPLIRIIDTSKLWLKANVPVAESTHVEHLVSSYFTISGVDQEFRPSRLVTVNDVVDPKTRTVQVILEVGNPTSKLKVGMFANIFLQAGHDEEVLAVPNTAIFEDEGKNFVYVQLGGETFVRREVSLGNKDTRFTAVVKGIAPTDHVVTNGGYYVKQASQSSKTPEGHGHEH